MNVYFSKSARLELEEAISHYNNKLEGLGDDLQAEVEVVTRRIAADPTSFPPYDMDSRICRTQRFPYGVIFEVLVDAV